MVTRQSQNQSRKSKSKSSEEGDFVVDPDSITNTNFARPTVGYMFELLLLPPQAQGNGQDDSDDDEEDEEDTKGERMGIMKLVLVATMVQIEGIDQTEFAKSNDEVWRDEFKESIDEDQAQDGGDGNGVEVGGLILTLLDTVREG